MQQLKARVGLGLKSRGGWQSRPDELVRSQILTRSLVDSSGLCILSASRFSLVSPLMDPSEPNFAFELMLKQDRNGRSPARMNRVPVPELPVTGPSPESQETRCHIQLDPKRTSMGK